MIISLARRTGKRERKKSTKTCSPAAMARPDPTNTIQVSSNTDKGSEKFKGRKNTYLKKTESEVLAMMATMQLAQKTLPTFDTYSRALIKPATFGFASE